MKTPPPSQLQREVWLVVPVALLLLILMSLFTLYTYRSAIDQLLEDSKQQAVRQAMAAATSLVEVPSPTSAELRRLAPRAAAIALVDVSGRLLLSSGDPITSVAPPGAAAGTVGPDSLAPEQIVAFSSIAGSPLRFVRIDFDARTLARQVRAVRLLTPLVLGINGSLGLLVFLFLRRFLRPYEKLLQRLRSQGSVERTASEETELLYRAFGLALDSLGRDRADEALAAVERTVAGSLGSGLLLVDGDQQLLALNPAAEELLGLSAIPFPTPLERVFEDHPRVLRDLTAAFSPGSRPSFVSASSEPGNSRRLAFTVHSLRRTDRSVRGWLILVSDWSTARGQAAEEQLAQTLADLGELAAGVAHELRNSLATLKGYLTLFERRRREEDLTEARNEIAQIERTVRDFLAFARPGHAEVEPVPVIPLLERLTADPALSGGVQIRLEVARPEDRQLTVFGDQQLLSQAFGNLLSNAVTASDEQPVDITVERTTERLVVRIGDRGRGIPSSIKERLFQPFVTGGSTGVGLGLALAHRVFALHGAELRLEDRAGGGTEARISLPLRTIVTDRNRKPEADA